MRVVIVTALYGKHSSLKEFDSHGFPCVCFTDDSSLLGTSKTWAIGSAEPAMNNPRLFAKRYKMFPEKFLPDFDVWIWIDSTITLTNTRLFVATCLGALEGHSVALFRHPDRSGIVEEASVSEGMPKYAGQRIVEQAMGYAREGMPLGELYAGGVVARTRNLPGSFGARWLIEMEKSLQDQISLPYVLWREGITPGIMPGSVYGSEFHTHLWEGPDR